ncbi:four-carbon acid sugar kinase family protein [Paenibacillus favisporus]|uniref:four-carbon acid sugar kinase family protein n=1 Tax=Paenibacillus favisporus TaxID=221028 RepID=UPI002DB5D550|nr:four-carbon acid sugar kinase family protein [Paenibacillus favisporus]MEC0178467.1 four-carbon acid sugar kinase family protein [Paenibacillus favisporus]
MIGVIADDITGANDIGIMFAKAGLTTHVYPADELRHGLPDPQPDVLVVDTNSRLDTADQAYAKVYTATVALRAAGCTRLVNKTCSVFRGNIGAEFDAMLDAVPAAFAVVVLGFPKNGRVTLDGVHYVHGKPLAESEFRHDPVHPMQESELTAILQAQTERKVAMLPIGVVEQGAEVLRGEINRMRGECAYLILDVRDQQSLRIIAEAVLDEPLLCGSSGLYEELAPLLKRADADRESSDRSTTGPVENGALYKRADLGADEEERTGKNLASAGTGPDGGQVDRAAADLIENSGLLSKDADASQDNAGSAGNPTRGEGVLLAAGSLMPQTAAQIACAREAGVTIIELDSLLLLEPARKNGHIADVVRRAGAKLAAGRDVLIHASNDAGKLAATRKRAEELGLSGTVLSRIVSDELAGAVADVAVRTGQRRVVIAGGETSAAVCGRLGITGLRVLKEIEPGLPSCMSLDGKARLLVLKSGSFGSPEFIVKAIEHLKGMNIHGESDCDERDL